MNKKDVQKNLIKAIINTDIPTYEIESLSGKWYAHFKEFTLHGDTENEVKAAAEDKAQELHYFKILTAVANTLGLDYGFNVKSRTFEFELNSLKEE